MSRDALHCASETSKHEVENGLGDDKASNHIGMALHFDFVTIVVVDKGSTVVIDCSTCFTLCTVSEDKGDNNRSEVSAASTTVSDGSDYADGPDEASQTHHDGADGQNKEKNGVESQ